MAFSVTCLAATGSLVGIVLAAAVLVGYAWWDTRSILNRQHRSTLMRFTGRLAPFAALGLAGWGVYLAWLHDESVAAGIGLTGTPPHVQRLLAYLRGLATATDHRPWPWLDRDRRRQRHDAVERQGDAGDQRVTKRACCTGWSKPARPGPAPSCSCLAQFTCESLRRWASAACHAPSFACRWRQACFCCCTAFQIPLSIFPASPGSMPFSSAPPAA